MTITNKQRKAFWITVSILGVLYFAPTVIMWVRKVSFAQQQAAQRQAARQRAAQQAALQKAQAQTSAPSVASDPNAALSKLVGVWEGAAVLPPARGYCTFRIEVRPGQQPAPFSGYSTLACSPALTAMVDPKASPGVMQAAMMGHGLNPLAAILTGEAKGDSIEFKVDKVFGAETSIGHCVPTSFTLSTFGTGTAGLDFEDSCGKNQMLLHRTAK